MEVRFGRGEKRIEIVVGPFMKLGKNVLFTRMKNPKSTCNLFR